MTSIQKILNKYSKEISHLDLELIIARVINKMREFILAHPEKILTKGQKIRIEKFIKRRKKNEPLAYILNEKEFYGTKYFVDKNVLIPRPDTELIVDKVIEKIKSLSPGKKTIVIDVGTGCGNIIISIASHFKNTLAEFSKLEFWGIDISRKAISVAKYNAKIHTVSKAIKLLAGNMLEPAKKIPYLKSGITHIIITANLPYLSPLLYSSTPKNVKKYEPKKALLSQNNGLAHYELLLKDISKIYQQNNLSVMFYFEISPEQKNKIKNLIRRHLPGSKIIFHKDLGDRWRMCETFISNNQSTV